LFILCIIAPFGLVVNQFLPIFPTASQLVDFEAYSTPKQLGDTKLPSPDEIH